MSVSIFDIICTFINSKFRTIDAIYLDKHSKKWQNIAFQNFEIEPYKIVKSLLLLKGCFSHAKTPTR